MSRQGWARFGPNETALRFELLVPHPRRAGAFHRGFVMRHVLLCVLIPRQIRHLKFISIHKAKSSQVSGGLALRIQFEM